jgi:hypothetical protein
MNGIGPGHFGGAQDVRDIAVTEGGFRRSDTDVLIRSPHVQTCGIGFGVDRNGFDAELFAGADHPKGDFSTIGNQHFLKHRILRRGSLAVSA